MKLIISHSPHIANKQSVKSIMWNVIIALIPALLFSVYYYGFDAFVVTATAVSSCIIFESLLLKYALNEKKSTINDGSAILTGILLSFNLPSSIPLWMVVIGSLVAIGIAKVSYGGLGQNAFNPALVGRVFMLISFPVKMTTWPTSVFVDAKTAATPLSIIKEGINNNEKISDLMSKIPSYIDLLIGNMGGSLGEISAIALIIGLIYMLWKKVITWHIPITICVTILVFSGILHLIDPEKFIDPIFHLLTGGILLGAIFMATDMATSPMSIKGMIIYSIFIGIITILIRTFGAYPEGMSFAILIMNGFVPLLNKYCKPAKFGGK